MKKLLVQLLLSAITISSFAQGLFNQKGEILKKNSKQITLLATYSGYVRKGYQIMEKGWDTVHSWKEDEFNLHVAYIRSLKKVNPKIKEERPEAVQALVEKLVSGCSRLRQDAIQSKILTGEEITYLKNILNSYIRETSENVEKLNLVITDGKLSMTDDERIKQVDELYDRTVNTLQELRAMESRTYDIISGRREMKQHNKELKQWLGIPR